jgi:hypothetical protein
MWSGCLWHQDLKDLMINTLIPLHALEEMFLSKHRTPEPQPLMALGGLLDLWLNHTTSWSPAAVAMINNMLTTSMWKRYVGYICHFHDYCWKHGHNFPLAELEAVGVIASFFKSATRVGQQPGTTLALMLAAIATLYKLTGSSPTRDPLLAHLHCTIMHTCTTQPI